jgi:hypothetical protein
MTEDNRTPDIPELPHGAKGSGVARSALNAVGGLIPFAGGLLSAAASAWSENEQNKINVFFAPLDADACRGNAREGTDNPRDSGSH